MTSLEEEDEMTRGPCFPSALRSMKELVKILSISFFESVLCHSFSCLTMYLINLGIIRMQSSLLSFYQMLFGVETQGLPVFLMYVMPDGFYLNKVFRAFSNLQQFRTCSKIKSYVLV